MASPTFYPGQVVEFVSGPDPQAWEPPSLYCVLRVYPPTSSGEWMYDVSSLHDGHRRILGATHLVGTNAVLATSNDNLVEAAQGS